VDPDYGTVVVNPDGTFTFTPSRAARLAAGLPGSDLTATITVTATNGLAATNTTLTVPISPYERGAVVDTIPVGWFVNTMALSPDGSYLYVTATDVDYETQTTTGTVKVVDTATGAVLQSIPTGSDQPRDIAFTPDGAYAYATMPNNTVLVINRGHAVFAAITTNEAPTDVAVTPDGKYAYVPNSGSPFGYVAVIDTATQQKIGEIPMASGGTDIAIADTPNGVLAYVTENGAGGTFTVKVIDTGVNIVVDSIGPLDIPAGSILASPDSSRVYISTNSVDGVVYVINTDTNSVESTIRVGNWISSPVLSPDGAYLYVVSGGTVLTIDTATNAVVGEPVSTVEEPLRLAVSADGNLLYIASATSDTLSVVYTGNRVDALAI
jgi:YVTN family beta-propeller protein/VCBS repeat-containing protein